MLMVIDIPEPVYEDLFPDKPRMYRGWTLDSLFLEMKIAIENGVKVEEKFGCYFPKEVLDGED